MKLQKNAETFNLGDTSFRRKTLMDDYKTILPYLVETNAVFEKWDTPAQADFYQQILENTNLFERSTSEGLDKRGRTLTNALVKIGLTNKNRRLSAVAWHWLDNQLTCADSIEKTLGIDTNNLLFLRQLLKLRVYAADGVHYFYPFRVALDLVSSYPHIPQQDFLTFIHLIDPLWDNQKIKLVIRHYKKVVTNNQIFSEFLDEEFPEGALTSSIDTLFSESKLDKDKFNHVFVNRKTPDSQAVYYDFVVALLAFKANQTDKTLSILLKIAKDSRIKKAFGFGKSVFVQEKVVADFIDKNQDHPLLSNNNKDIYHQFVLSKKEDLVKEYRDMTKRTFNLTGLLDFSNGLVNAVNREVIKVVFSDLDLAGEGSYSDYEETFDSLFYQDVTLQEIISLDESAVLVELKKIFKVENLSSIEAEIGLYKEKKFRDFIDRTFPRDKILALLPLFSERQDEEIKKQVSEFATVPTIYEYIMAIAWYHLSSKEFFLLQSLNLTLDGNMRPLSHAAGGAGDIVIQYEDLTLMLEVTLMNQQAQKRGEWEPVLRHATNLTVDEYPKNVITLFIADELDENTINIWRAVASVPLKSSNRDEYAELVKIFPLTNAEIMDMLKAGKNEQGLLQMIDESYTEYAGNFNLAWREEILEEAAIREDT